MSLNVIAERVFAVADQEWFASVSGDRNPMHMDALAARRTIAGFPVVHGIHALLWALDSVCEDLPELRGLASIKASFERMIYIGDRIRAVLLYRNREKLRIEVMVGEVTTVGLDVEFGDPRPGDDTLGEGPLHQPNQPSDLTFDQMAACHGWVALPTAMASMSQMFPAAARALGGERIAALACSSFLVGMVCPGLHSIYRNLHLATTPVDHDAHDGLHFRVKYSDPDYRLVRLAVSGAGWTGLVETFARPAPTPQADLASIAARVAPGEFDGAFALIVGGSRGLGELIGKILAVGGANVMLTYVVGEADARRLQAEIVDFGGRCDIMRYDVRKIAEEQLSGLPTVPNEMYYMATPRIFQRAGVVFSADRLQEYLAYYVTGFRELCQALRSIAGPDMAIFYPSSVAIDERPANMTEYTMAKAAGEVLCADMQTFEKWRRVLVRRLPRLPTDQTSTVYDDEFDDPIEAMLPIVRDLHSGRVR